jgi:hypothetical protein
MCKFLCRVYESTACGKNQVITEIKAQPAVVELLLNLLCACMTSPMIKGWNRNGNVLSTQIDGSDGAGPKYDHRGLVGYPHVNNGGSPQSFEPFPYNMGFEFDDGTQVLLRFYFLFVSFFVSFLFPFVSFFVSFLFPFLFHMLTILTCLIFLI